MNKIFDFDRFIKENPLTPITVGQSGAEVYAAGEAYILKRASRVQIADDWRWNSYVREAQMYTYFGKINMDFVPESPYINYDADKIEIILSRGEMLSHTALQGEILSQVMDVLVKIHHTEIPDFLPRPSVYTPLSAEKIKDCLDGWLCVLAEHPERFDTAPLYLAAEQITPINLAFSQRQHVLTHGDFHCENLLMMPDRSIRVCDWQSAGVSDPAGDLSFLHSRLSADGIDISLKTLIDAYCIASARAGFAADAQVLLKSAALANFNTSFEFWHMYLHGADAARVAGVYEKMIEDLNLLLN